MKVYRIPPDVHAPIGAYTHQIELTPPERMLILSGQVGRRQDGTVPEDAIEQVQIAWDNLRRNLQVANMAVEDIVKLTFYLVGPIDIERFRTVNAGYLKDFRPRMTLLFVVSLASPIYKVEIDAWASQTV